MPEYLREGPVRPIQRVNRQNNLAGMINNNQEERRPRNQN